MSSEALLQWLVPEVMAKEYVSIGFEGSLNSISCAGPHHVLHLCKVMQLLQGDLAMLTTCREYTSCCACRAISCCQCHSGWAPTCCAGAQATKSHILGPILSRPCLSDAQLLCGDAATRDIDIACTIPLIVETVEFVGLMGVHKTDCSAEIRLVLLVHSSS